MQRMNDRPMRNLGLLLEYELTLRRQKQFETRARVAACVIQPASRTSTSDPSRPRPRALPQARRLRLDRRAPQLLVTGASGWARVGSPAHSAIRRAERTCPFSTPACRGSSPISPSRTAMRATPGFCALWRASNCSSSMMGTRNPHARSSARLLEIVEDRYDKGSLIITSQVPVDRWHDLIGVSAGAQ